MRQNKIVYKQTTSCWLAMNCGCQLHPGTSCILPSSTRECVFIIFIWIAGWRKPSREVWITIYSAKSKMDKVNQKMKKFNLRGVLDGLRSSVSAPPKLDIDIEENLRSEHFQVAKVGGLAVRIVASCQ